MLFKRLATPPRVTGLASFLGFALFRSHEVLVAVLLPQPFVLLCFGELTYVGFIGTQPLAFNVGTAEVAMLDNPARAVIAGLVLAALTLAVWLLIGPVDPRGLVSVLLRFVHVLSAMVWVGLIFFVNFIQLRALQDADVPSRSAIAKWIVPHVATMFRHASHLTVLSGALLLVAAGYLLGSWVFASAVYMSLARALMLAAGALGGLLMWTLVNLAIWPNLKIVLGQATGDAEAARQTVKRYARLNLVLAMPVTFVMVAAAHLS